VVNTIFQQKNHDIEKEDTAAFENLELDFEISQVISSWRKERYQKKEDCRWKDDKKKFKVNNENTVSRSEQSFYGDNKKSSQSFRRRNSNINLTSTGNSDIRNLFPAQKEVILDNVFYVVCELFCFLTIESVNGEQTILILKE